MARRVKGKKKTVEGSTLQPDSPDRESVDAGPSNIEDTPIKDVPASDVATCGPQMSQGDLLPTATPSQPESTSVVSTTDALNILVGDSVESWAGDATAVSGSAEKVTENTSARPTHIWSASVPIAVNMSLEPVQFSRTKIDEYELPSPFLMIKYQEILTERASQQNPPLMTLTGERGLFELQIDQGRLTNIATKYRQKLSNLFPSGKTLYFPQTPQSVLRYVGQFVSYGSVDALYPGAESYPRSNLQALVHLQNIASELGIVELEERASRDIALAQRFLDTNSRWTLAIERRGNPELFVIMAEYGNRLYSVHCRRHQLEMRGRQVTRGTLHCMGVVNHFPDRALPPGPFEVVAADKDELWTVTCSVAMLRVAFPLRRGLDIAGHLTLINFAV